MNIKQQNDRLQPTILFTVTNVAILQRRGCANDCLAKPTQAQILVSANPNLSLGNVKRINATTDLSTTLVQSPNDNSDRFMREQLNSSGSNTSAPLQNLNSDWSQPIGWLFGVLFVILGSIVAWSKYVRKR